MSVKNSLSVVLAGYNEEKNIIEAIETNIRVLSEYIDDWELILVDDGSSDNTGEIMKQYSDKYNNIIFLSDIVNLNFGVGVLRGLYTASKEYVIYNAIDLPLSPEMMPGLLQKMQEDELDILVLQREGYKTTKLRKVTSVGNGIVLKMLFPILTKGTPVLNFVQMFRTSVLSDIKPCARSPIFVWPELIFRGKLLKKKWANVKVQCNIKEVRQGAFGNLHVILWGVHDMLRFKMLVKNIKKINKN